MRVWLCLVLLASGCERVIGIDELTLADGGISSGGFDGFFAPDAPTCVEGTRSSASGSGSDSGSPCLPLPAVLVQTDRQGDGRP